MVVQDGSGGDGGERPAKKRVSKKINYEAVVQLTKEQLPDDIPPEFEGLLGFPIRSGEEEEEVAQGKEGTAEGATEGATPMEEGERAGRSVLLGRARIEEEEEEEEDDDEEEDEEEEEEEKSPAASEADEEP